MINNNFVKVKWQNYKDKFKTKEGLFDVFVATALYGFLIVQFNQIIFNFFMGTFSSLPSFFQFYLSYLFFGIAIIVLGILVTIFINKIYKFLLKKMRGAKPIKNEQ